MKRVAISSLCLAILLSGCSSNDIYSGNVYTADQAKQVQYISYGTILSVRPVYIQANTNGTTTDNALGSIGGAVIGGILGSTIGKGTGSTLGAAVGAIGGAIAGSSIENEVNKLNAVELEIRQEDGPIIAIVQKSDPNEFYVGQAVKLVSNGKRINVSPRQE